MTDEPSGPAAPSCAPSLPRMFTIAAVSDMTDLSAATIRRHVRLKHLAVHRIGGAMRIAEPDLAAWLARQRRAAR